MERKKILHLAFGIFAAGMLMSAMPGDSVISRQGDVTVVNTTTLTADVEGYLGTTPLKIYIKANKIDKVEALPNQETPKYFARVKREMLPKYEGMTVAKALKSKVDGVTGATMSSDAVRTNVQRGLEYYTRNGKKK